MRELSNLEVGFVSGGSGFQCPTGYTVTNVTPQTNASGQVTGYSYTCERNWSVAMEDVTEVLEAIGTVVAIAAGLLVIFVAGS